jgi:ABC-2 type transport system permease protein
MLSGFREHLKVLAINLRNTYEVDTAYFFENLSGILSTLVYTFSYLAFIHVLYANVNQIAGYSRDEMLFFALVGQMSFYVAFMWSVENVENLISDVNRGALDLLLVKPLPALFYASTRSLTTVRFVRNATVPLAAVSASIAWENLNISWWSLLAGIGVFICGHLIFHTLQLLLALPAFWLGESRGLFSMVYSLSDLELPYEGWGPRLRAGLTVVLPILIPACLTTSVILGKSPAGLMLILAMLVAAAFLVIRRAAWETALRHYSSASS